MACIWVQSCTLRVFQLGHDIDLSYWGFFIIEESSIVFKGLDLLKIDVLYIHIRTLNVISNYSWLIFFLQL